MDEIEKKEEETTEEVEEKTETIEVESDDSKENIKLTDEEKLARLEGGAKRLRKKLGIAEPVVKKEEVKKESKSADLELVQETYLIANGIKEESEIGLVKKIMDATGKSMKEVLGSKYFQAELTELRDEKATKNATPSSSKRSSSVARDTVEFWIAKGEMPEGNDPATTKLRRDIVNAKMKQQKNTHHFSDNPLGSLEIRK